MLPADGLWLPGGAGSFQAMLEKRSCKPAMDLAIHVVEDTENRGKIEM